MCFSYRLVYQHQKADRSFSEQKPKTHRQKLNLDVHLFISFCVSLFNGAPHLDFYFFSLKSYSSLLVVDDNIEDDVVFGPHCRLPVPLLAWLLLLFSSHSIPCSFSSAGWFLVFPFSVDWNRLPLNRENRYMQNPKQQRRREGKRDIATSCCVFICTFFPFTLLFSNFLSWHLGLIPFWARDKKKFCIWIYILYMTIWTLKCSYSNSFVCLSWVKASLTLSFIQTLSRTVCGGDWWVNWE